MAISESPIAELDLEERSGLPMSGLLALGLLGFIAILTETL